jgi:hypothetical protein
VAAGFDLLLPFAFHLHTLCGVAPFHSPQFTTIIKLVTKLFEAQSEDVASAGVTTGEAYETYAGHLQRAQSGRRVVGQSPAERTGSAFDEGGAGREGAEGIHQHRSINGIHNRSIVSRQSDPNHAAAARYSEAGINRSDVLLANRLSTGSNRGGSKHVTTRIESGSDAAPYVHVNTSSGLHGARGGYFTRDLIKPAYV